MIGAVDLFCGAGGLTAGLRKAGVKVHAGYDNEILCKYAFQHNNKAKFVEKDVTTVTGQEIASWFSNDKIRLLAGCAPCQPFSSYNNGRDTKLDRKWPLLNEFTRLIREVHPELVTMENVPDIVNHYIYDDFVEELRSQGYYIWADRVCCAEYGLPQQRKRHVLLASLLGPISLISPTHKSNPRTVYQAINSLPPIAAGEEHPKDPLHKAQKLSETNLTRIRASRPGGTWRDWPTELRTKCHQRSSGMTYPSVYGRMSWDSPSPTMTTLCYGFGNGRFGHPEQDRAISLREAAILQSFPRGYRFVPVGEPISFKSVGRMIGNAVPVRLGEIIGKSLQKHVKENIQT